MENLFITLRKDDKGEVVLATYSKNEGFKLYPFKPSSSQFQSITRGKTLVGYNLSSIFKIFNIADLSFLHDYHDLYLLARLHLYKELSNLKQITLNDVLEALNIPEVVEMPFDYMVSDAKAYRAKSSLLKKELQMLELLYNKLIQYENSYYKLIEKPMLAVVADMQLRGIHIDRDKVNKLYLKVMIEQQDLVSEFKKLTNQTKVQGLRLKVQKFSVNLNSPQQIAMAKKDLLYLLNEVEDPNIKEAIKVLIRYRELEKKRQYLEKYNVPRLTGTFLVTGTASGRMSCFKENLQQIPRDLREIIVPPEGKALVKLDFSQIELRIATLFYARKFHQLFKEGVDLHKHTASLLLNKPEEEITDCQEFYSKFNVQSSRTEEERQLAKAVNFGLLYGISTKGLRDYIFSMTGQLFDYEEVDYFRKRWFEIYDDIADEHRRVFEHIKRWGEYKGETLLGRPFYIKGLENFTKALNYKIQGTGADFLKVVAIKCFEKGIRFINLIHDELVAVVDSEEQALEVGNLMVDITNKTWFNFVEVALKKNSYIDYIPLPLTFSITT